MPNELKPCPVMDSVRAFPNAIAIELCARCPNRRDQSPAVRELVEAARAMVSVAQEYYDMEYGVRRERGTGNRARQ